MLWEGLGSTRAGWMVRRGESISSESMLASSMRTSRSVSPGEARRRCCISCTLEAAIDSTSTLRTPSCSMNASDSSRAPAPMASIPITDPTPNTMPSAVSTRARFLRAQIIESVRNVGEIARELHLACGSACVADGADFFS